MKKNSKQDNKTNKRIRRIVEIVIIIIILLLLITCCTSKYYGKIGNLFQNSSNHNIDDKTTTKKIIVNEDFSLDTNESNIYMSDDDYRISYSYNNINPNEVTCSTDDANIATCYVENGFVVVKPKKEGSTNVSIFTDVNGATYKSTSKINITDDNRSLSLTSTSGTINLAYSTTRTIGINADSLSGNLTVESSDEEIASVIIKNRKIIITAKKKGNVLITVTSKEKDKDFTATYKLSVENKEIEVTTKKTKKTTTTTKANTTTSSSSKSTTKSTTTTSKTTIIEPTTKKTEPILSSNNKLKKINVSKGMLSPIFDSNIYDYSVSVSDLIDSINIDVVKGDDKQTLTYQYKGVSLTNLNDLSLDYNSNILTIEVTAQDGTKQTYKVTINRNKSNDCYLNSLTTSIGQLSPNFDKNTTGYSINVGTDDNNITLTASANTKSTVKYKFKNHVVSSLNNLTLDYGNNVVEIEVTAQNGNKKTYVITIIRPKDSNNNLSGLTTSQGTISPSFDKNKTSYSVEVNNDISSLNVNAVKESNKSTIKYYYNGIEVTNLNNLTIGFDTNNASIVVTAQDGTEKTYTLKIIRKKSNNNNLSSLSITGDGEGLNPTFDKNITNYTFITKYNTNKVTINAITENQYATIKYFLNGEEISSSNIPISIGNNTIIVEVTAQDGTNKNYTIVVHRPNRTIEFDNNNININMDTTVLPYQLTYKVLEDGNEVSDFNVTDLTITTDQVFAGTIDKSDKNIIKITPTNSDIGKTIKFTISYNGKTSDANIKISTNDYYLETYATSYDIIYKNGAGIKNIIFNNNILSGTITSSDILNGIRIKKDNNHYIDITSSNTSIVKPVYKAGSTSLSIDATVLTNTGTVVLTAKAYAYGSQVGNDVNINLTIKAKYNVKIDANGGLFYELSGTSYSGGITSTYEYLLDANTNVNLSNYIGLKENDNENCEYYTQIGFSTNKNSTIKEYENNDVITITKNITLYSIYETTSGVLNVLNSGTVYLTEVDIFHNEEYEAKYGVDNVIYPGANGSHIMTINNTGTGKLKINKIRLQEDTVCIEKNKCINMGYVIKKYVDNGSDIYFLGGSNNFDVINKTATYGSTTKNPGILTPYQTTKEIDTSSNFVINPNESAEVSIIWKWVEIDDELDTNIGKQEDTINYYLTVSLDYEREDSHCSLNP